MADEKDKEIEEKEVEEIEKREKEESKFDDRFVSESYTKKFIKTGLLAVGSAILFKGGSKNDELLKFGVTAAASLALSEDKEYSKDAIVLASLFGVKNAAKLGKALAHSNPELFKKGYKAATKADSILNNINLAHMNFGYKFRDTFSSNFDLYKMKNSNFQPKGKLDSLLFVVKGASYSSFKTGKDSLSFLYHHGIQESLKEINNNTFYNQYKSFNKAHKIQELELLAHDITETFGLDIKEFEVNSFDSTVDALLNKVIPSKYASKLQEYKEASLNFKKFKKFQKIEENTFFSDFFGLYTNMDSNGKINVRMNKLLQDDMTFVGGLEQLAFDFKKTVRANKAREFDVLSDEDKTKMFIDYLKDNGFGELVEKAYKKDNLINFGELETMLKEQTNGMDEFVYTARKSSAKFIKEVGDSDATIHNLDILKDFAVTNVVKKTSNGFFDETSLNGHIGFMRSLGVLEKNVLGTFQIPILDKTINLWNPFKLLESDARIKNEIVNNVMGFYHNEKGYMLNKLYISEGIKKITSKKIFNGELITDHNYGIRKFTIDDTREAKVIFNKSLLSITNEGYKVSKGAIKKHKTYTELYHDFRHKGFKSGLESFMNSQINPTVFRYNKKRGFYKINSQDGYFKEGTILSRYFNKTDINVSDVRTENRFVDRYVKNIKKNLIDQAVEYDSTNTNTTQANMRREIYNFLTKNTVKPVANTDGEKEALNGLLDLLNVYKKKKVNDESFVIYLKNIREYVDEIEGIDDNFRIVLKKFGDNEFAAHTILRPKRKAFGSIVENIEDVRNYMYNSVGNKNNSIMTAINEYNKNRFDGNKEFYNMYEDIKNFVSDYDESMFDVKKQINDLLHSKNFGSHNFIDDYNVQVPIENENSIFNPIYEIVRGKEINRITKKYMKGGKTFAAYGLSFVDEDLEFSNTGITTIKEFIKTSNKVFKDKFFYDYEGEFGQSYKIYDEIENTIIKSKRIAKKDRFEQIDNKSFVELVYEYNQIKYQNSETKMVSSTIIRKAEIDYRDVRATLNRVRESIVNLFTGNKSKHEELESQMNLLSKLAISQLQDSAESLGIERLTQESLGDNGFKQLASILKYRVAPLFVLGSTAIAADTLSDALVPDEVPIVGNGISGVAVRGIASSRIGLQYMLKGTGILSIMRGMENAVPGLFDNAIGDALDILMSPEEMIDVYFKGKPIEVKDNRWWFTAGRQSGQGEEFRQYRPHLWYIWQHKDSGVYSNKFEKLFRKDFLPTSLAWYMLDPYKEEREAYEKYGAVYPMTEQLFTGIPVIGHFLNATVGEVIKPTQLIGEDKWLVGDDMMRNPNYDPNDPSSPKYIKFSQPNKISRSIFEAFEDLKTFAGIQGYAATKITEALFGVTNPYQNEIALDSIDQDTGLYSKYERLQLGDMFGITEPIRRFIDDNDSLGMIEMNPLEQNLPDWIPDYFRKGNNPYLKWDFGNYILPGEEFNENKKQNTGNEELNKFRILSLISPTSKEYKQLKDDIFNKIDSFSDDEKTNIYESIAFADSYGDRDYLNIYEGRARDIKNINLKIDKKISPTEFISKGKRYKFDSVTDDFNKLSSKYGSKTATKMINELDNMFQEGQTYSFKMSQDASYSVGIDDEGDYFKIDSEDINNKYNLDKSGYRKNSVFSSILKKVPFGIFSLQQLAPTTLGFEKIFGKKDVVTEWSSETVQAPYFRDWDSPISSFLEPIYTYSSNNFTSAYHFNKYANDVYLNSNSTFNLFGTLNKLGMLKLPFNKLTDNVTKSSQYENETIVHDELEKIKFVAGDKSFYNMTGRENLKQFSKMVNEQDAEFLEDLANVSNKKQREKILNTGNERLATVLKTIWNRHQMAVNNTLAYEDVGEHTFDEVLDIGAYYGNPDDTRNRIKSSLGISLSKLDIKRQGVFNAYRGTESERQAKFIHDRMYRQYNSKPNVISTIYGNGTININRRREQY